MLPRTHAWSHKQKSLIVAAAAVALASFGTLIYSYERYHRGPTDTVLFGTWQMTMPFGMDSTDWVALKPDHTLVWFSDSIAGYAVDSRGHWYAGGKYIYMRHEGKQHIWEIIEILPNQLRLRYAKQDYIFKRVTREPPDASNQTMQRTATRYATTFSNDQSTSTSIGLCHDKACGYRGVLSRPMLSYGRAFTGFCGPLRGRGHAAKSPCEQDFRASC